MSFTTEVPQSPWEFLTQYGDGLRSMTNFDTRLGDGIYDCTQELKDALEVGNRTGKPVHIAKGESSGIYCFSEALNLTGDTKLLLSPGVILRGTNRFGLRIKLSGYNNVIGGYGWEIQNWPSRRYRLSAGTSTGTSATFTILQEDLDELGPHPFVRGFEIRLQCVTLVSGTINDTEFTITNSTDTTFTISTSAVVDETVTYPIDPLDGMGRSIYPFVYGARSNAHDDSLIVARDAVNFHIYGGTLRYVSNGFFRSINSANGRIEQLTGYQSGSDGFSITYRSHDIDIVNCESYESCDTAFSLLGYKKDGAPIYNVRLNGIRLGNMWGKGRGLDWVGTKNCSAVNVLMNDVVLAGIYCFMDASAETYGNENYLFQNITMKGVGCDTNNWPTGWNGTNYAAITFGGSTAYQDQDIGGTWKNILIMNSRYRAIANSSRQSIRTVMDNIEIIETASHVWVDHLLADAKISNLRARNIGDGIFHFDASGASGTTEWKNITFDNINVGTRRWLQSASVSSNILTLVFAPGVGTSAFTSAAFVISGVGSTYDSETDSAAEVANDYRINSTYALAHTRTASSTGDILTVTSVTNLSTTAHASCYVSSQPCPVAYAALRAGGSAARDAFYIGSTCTGYNLFDTVVHSSNVYTFHRPFEVESGIEHRVLFRDAKFLASSTADVNNVAPFLGNGTHFQMCLLSSTSAQAIPAYVVRSAGVRRTGITSSVAVDPMTSAAMMIASLPYVYNDMRVLVPIYNYSGSVMAMSSGAGVTISGNVSTAASTVSYWDVSFDNVRPGQEAITWTRLFGSAIT